MKKIYFIAMVLINAWIFLPKKSDAQVIKSGSLDFLQTNNAFSVSIDFSQSKIKKMSYNVYCELDEDWKKDEKDIQKRFKLAMAEGFAKYNIDILNEAPVSLLLFPTTIDNDGETRAYLEIRDSDNAVLAVIEGIHGEGGRFGSLANLVGDGMERIAHSFVKYLIKQKNNILSESSTRKKMSKVEKQAAKNAKEKEKFEKQKAKEAKWRENIEKYK